MLKFQPRNEEEVAAAFAEARGKGLQIVPSGSGTKLGWRIWATPDDGDLAVVTSRSLEEIVDLDAGNLTVSVQAGLEYVALQSELAKAGLWYPVESPWGEEATVGGIVATGTAGPRAFGYGAPRDTVLGVRAVLPTGVTVRFGGKTVKNVAGYDISKLLVGSFGTLAFLTEVTLRLRPVPQEERTLLVFTNDYSQADEVVAALLSTTDPIISLEALNRKALETAGSGEYGPQAGVACALAIHLEGTRAAVRAASDKLVTLIRRRASDARIEVLGQESSPQFWKAYNEGLYRSWRQGETVLRVRCRVAGALQFLERISASEVAVAWIGAGTGQGYVRLPEYQGSEEVLDFVRWLRRILHDLDGQADVLVAPPAIVRLFLSGREPLWQLAETAALRMRALRRIFDPQDLLAPFSPFAESGLEQAA